MPRNYQSFLTRNLLNLPLGMFIGAELVLGMILMTELYFPDEGHPVSVLSLAMPVTLLTAMVAVAGILASIQAQQEREEEARRRKLMAARAVLPNTLIAMDEVCLQMARKARELGGDGHLIYEDEFREASFSILLLESALVERLQDVIEHHEDFQLANRIRTWLADFQVYGSRWKGQFQGRRVIEVERESNIAQRVLEWVYLSELAASMIEHARSDNNRLDPVNGVSLRRALRIELNVYSPSAEYEEKIISFEQKYLRDHSE